jgi:hypothetical protein
MLDPRGGACQAQCSAREARRSLLRGVTKAGFEKKMSAFAPGKSTERGSGVPNRIVTLQTVIAPARGQPLFISTWSKLAVKWGDAYADKVRDDDFGFHFQSQRLGIQIQRPGSVHVATTPVAIYAR